MQATSTWELPAGWVRISSETWGPFVIRELVRRPDGEVVEFTARRHRKGYGPRRAREVTGPVIAQRGAPMLFCGRRAKSVGGSGFSS
jgi:hypothetical protein